MQINLSGQKMLHLLAAKLFPWAVGVRWRPILRVALSMAVFLLCVYCYLQHVALKQNQLIYKHPAVFQKTRIVRIEGPVRIVTRVVETPGRVERETVEERGPVSTTEDSSVVQAPVFPPSKRSDRWLAGISANPFNYRDYRAWGAYVGYGFMNRFDICGGISRGKTSVLIIARF